jgi:hypothetical protein
VDDVSIPRRPPTYESPMRKNQRRQFNDRYRDNTGNHSRPLLDDEFIYPLNTKPKTIFTNELNKAAQRWDLQITDADDLRGAYERLLSRMAEYNVRLTPYEEITKENQCCPLTPNNCVNYKSARAAMSKAIFIVMEDNAATSYFKDYTEPMTFIKGYSRDQDGYGYITHVMEATHPQLKIESNRKVPAPPIFSNYDTLYDFINAYMDWIEDETIRSNREYSNREKIDFVRDALDERYNTAKKKISNKLDDLDSGALTSFPKDLILTTRLAKHIISLLNEHEQATLKKLNARGIIHKFGREERYQNRYDRNKFNDKNSSSNKYNYKVKDRETDMSKWADKLEWKLLPGEKCPACNMINHKVYSTGCPTFAKYAACKAFYDKCPPDKIKAVIQSFNKYQRELARKQLERRNNDRRAIRTLALKYNPDDITEIKSHFFEKYKEEYVDEKDRETNPYDDLTDEMYFLDYDSEDE